MKYTRIVLLLLSMSCSLTVTFSQSPELNLSAAIEKGLERNYGISISRAELSISEINNNWGTAGRYPSIAFEASSGNSFDIQDKSINNRLTAGIGMDWLLFNGFRVNTTKSMLGNTEELSSGRLAVLVENTIEEIILGYYSVLLEQERLGVLQTVMTLSRDRYEYELKRKSLGSALTYEVLQAENVYLSDKASFLEQEMRVRIAKRNLNFILAEDPAVSFDFTEVFRADTTHYALSDLKEKMLANNRNLKNQYINLLLKQDESKLRESAYYPSLSASLGIDNTSSRLDAGTAVPTTSNSLSPYANFRLSYDIYSGGVRKRAVKVAEINEEIAQTETEEMEHALTNELFNLYDYHEVRISLLEVAEKSLAAAELNMKISEEKYKSGVINSFNYRDVQLLYLEASLRRLQAIYNLVESKSGLTRITGGYLEEQ